MLQAKENQEVVLKFESDRFANKTFYLAGYYGKFTVLLDTVVATPNGTILFEKEQKHPQGMYMLVDENKSIVGEFLLDQDQDFSVKVDATNFQESVVFNSQLNEDYFRFLKFFSTQQTKVAALEKKLQQNGDSNKVIQLKQELQVEKKLILAYKKSYQAQNSNSVLSLMFAMTLPLEEYFDYYDVKQAPAHTADSTKLLKKLFLKGLNFNDDRLLRNPFLENKIATYFDAFVVPDPTVLSNEICAILDGIDNHEGDVFSYLSLYFLNTYMTPKIMGNDRVFVTLYEHYFNKRGYSWLAEEQRLLLEYNYKSLRNNLIGDKVPNLFMRTLENKTFNLYDLQTPYVALVFWDPFCQHCIDELPKIKKTYDALWEDKGIQVYAVNINTEGEQEWKDFIEQEKLQEWVHVTPSKEVFGNYTQEDLNFQMLYNINQTPALFLLNNKKELLAKNIDFGEYMTIITDLEKTK